MSGPTIHRATHTGTLFDGLMDVHVLEDGTRLSTQRGVIRALKTGGTKNGDLGRNLAKLPKRFAHLAVTPRIEFVTVNGQRANGCSVEWIADLLSAYVDAYMCGELHHKQEPLAKNAHKMQMAIAKIGLVALVDEATGYEEIRKAGELSFMFRAILSESTGEWDLMWPPDFVDAIMRLHGKRFNGGTHPQWLASTYEKLYAIILTPEVASELKKRNPHPSFGTNHHQWLTPEAKRILHAQVPFVTELANQSRTKAEFWERVEHRYSNKMLQMTCFGGEAA